MSLIKDIAIGMRVDTKGIANSLRTADKLFGAFNLSIQKVGTSVAALAGSFAAASTAFAAVDSLKGAIADAIKFEKAITGLSKATDLEGASLASMKDEVFALSTELKGVKLDDLIGIATSGAKMGVANDQLIEYTRGVAMLSTAVDDIPAEALADQIGTLNSVFKLGQKGALQIGSALDKIADSGLSSASGILDVTSRVAGTANAMKLGAGDSMALAAALLDTGTQAEQSASSINNLLMNMVAVGNHADFAKTAGVSVKEFGQMVADRPMKAIEAFLGGLQKLSAASQLEALEGVGIKAQERQSSIQKLAQQTEKLGEYTKIAANEFKTLNQITASYNATAKTTDAQWTQFQNRVDGISDTLGGTFLPAINSTLGTVGEKIEQANRAAKRLIETIKSVGPSLPKGFSFDVGGNIANSAATALLGPLAPLLGAGVAAVGGKPAAKAIPKPANNAAAAAKQAMVAQKARNAGLDDAGPVETKEARKAAATAAKAAEAARKKAAADAVREAKAARKKLTDDAQAVIEATRTPMEQYKAKLGELNTLLGAKAIDSTTFQRATEAARKDIFGMDETTHAGAFQRGSAEAYSAQLRFGAQGQGSRDEPMKEVAKQAPKQTDLLKQLLASFNKFADRAGSQAIEMVTGF